MQTTLVRAASAALVSAAILLTATAPAVADGRHSRVVTPDGSAAKVQAHKGSKAHGKRHSGRNKRHSGRHTQGTERRETRCRNRRHRQGPCARGAGRKAPETTITSGPEGDVTTQEASFGFTSSFATASFQCRVDGSAWSGCTSPRTYTSAVGTHTFEVRALSRRGVADRTPASRAWTVVAPQPAPTTPDDTTTTTPDDTTTTTPDDTTTTTPDSTAPAEAPGPCYAASSTHTTYERQAAWAPSSRDFIPMSDDAAAAEVTPAAERRPLNHTPNNTCPTDAELATFHTAKDRWGLSESNLGTTFNPYHKFVSGRFVGTTDEIIQWAAHKWGIPEDLIRAQLVAESWWRMGTMGDRTTVADPGLYPEFSRITGTSDVFESLGIAQVKWRPDGSVNTGTEPLRWKSTAFNIDAYASVVRFYFDDPMQHRSNWGDASYAPGDPWLSIGGWYQPSPWGNSDQAAYIEKVKGELANRTWESASFQNG